MPKKILSFNHSLQVLKLPSVYYFNLESAKSFCKYLKGNSTLRNLHASETITIALECFIDALEQNKIMQKLCLISCKAHLEYSFKIEDFIKILLLLPYTAITKFKAFSSFFILDEDEIEKTWKKESFPEYIKGDKCSKFLEAVDYLLRNSKNLRKLNIGIEDMPERYIEQISYNIIDHVKSLHLECFCGFNLESMLKGKIERNIVMKKQSELREKEVLNCAELILYKIIAIWVTNYS